MFKGRTAFYLLILILLVFAGYLLLKRSGGLPGLSSEDVDLPLDLQRVIPAEWTPVAGQRDQCDFDGDKEEEWLIVYRYDTASVARPNRSPEAPVDRGPIGAVIYDAQATDLPPTTSTPTLYRPTYLVPYKLLPDFFSGKGQGYLGESSVESIYYPPKVKGQTCEVKEIAFLGYSGYGESELATRLSIFRWSDNRTTGYQSAHFVGNARIAIAGPTDGTQPIADVTTYDHLQNHRSLLCEVHRFSRPDANLLAFTEDAAASTVDFCYGAPDDPSYPEGAVVALLRGQNPRKVADTAPALPGAGYLLPSAIPPFQMDLTSVGRTPIAILSVTNQGGVVIDPAGGHRCSQAEIGDVLDTWWCGREMAQVVTEITSLGQVRRIVWTLITVTPDQVNATPHWRVQTLEMQ